MCLVATYAVAGTVLWCTYNLPSYPKISNADPKLRPQGGLARKPCLPPIHGLVGALHKLTHRRVETLRSENNCQTHPLQHVTASQIHQLNNHR
jgi:hypothetical protein